MSWYGLFLRVLKPLSLVLAFVEGYANRCDERQVNVCSDRHEILRELVSCLSPLRVTELVEAYRLLVSEDLSNIEEAPADMGNRTSIKRDVCRAVKPVALDIQLDLLAIGSVLEMDRGLRGADREVT